MPGFFDDRSPDRAWTPTSDKVLGSLDSLPDYIRQHGVREVYITCPGLQPRIVELLERIQGTTASLFFVPDVFGISIIQGRLLDLAGMPVVGICETPSPAPTVDEAHQRHRAASIILVLISPLLVLIAIGVKLSLARPHHLQATPQWAGWRRDRLQIPLHAHDGQRPRGQAGHQGRPRITRFGAFIAAPRLTNCRSSSMCCRAA